MPVKPVKDGDKWCIEDDAGKRHGACHDSRADALAQVRAINANMEKEIADSFLDTLAQRILKIISNSRGHEEEILQDPPPEDPKEETIEQKAKTGLMTWKGKDDQWYWLARYSNSFRDEDNPPEIISSVSHKRFVKMVDKGHYPYPELWMWHEPSWKWGNATFLGFDEVAPGVGFAIAGGTVDKGKEWIAEKFVNNPRFLVSHGMPFTEIVKDSSDPTIYMEHQTSEISPLPSTKAANKRTGFKVYRKEIDMALSEEKRQEMAESLGVDQETLREVEQSNQQEASKAVIEGAEFKEKEEQAPEKENVSEKEVYVTEQQFAQFTQELTKGFADAMAVIKDGMTELREEVKSLRAEKEAEQKALTPAASLYATMMSAVTPAPSKKEIENLAPQETENVLPQLSGTNGPGIPFLNQMHVMNAREVRR